MAIYSIKDIELLSGVKAHTLRIWEQRYDFLKPKRTDTNIRYYTDEDLRHILNVATLNRNGFRISAISKMDVEELTENVKQCTSNPERLDARIDAMVLAMIDLDEVAFNQHLQTSILQIGVNRTFQEVIFPFLEHIGLMWTTGSIRPLQEHFISALIRQKIIVAIDGQGHLKKAELMRCLLFLPEFEQHELGLLFANYLLRSHGHEVLYLGAGLPTADIQEAMERYRPDLVFCCQIIADPDGVFRTVYSQQMKQNPKTIFWSTGRQFVTDPGPELPNHLVLDTIDSTLKAVAALD